MGICSVEGFFGTDIDNFLICKTLKFRMKRMNVYSEAGSAMTVQMRADACLIEAADPSFSVPRKLCIVRYS
jgi:hypothetical protein